MAISGSLNFLSASTIGSYTSSISSEQVPFVHYFGVSSSAPGFIPNDFVGLNTNIYEPITASENNLGYPRAGAANLHSGDYRQTYPYKGGLIDYSACWAGCTNQPNGSTRVLNGLLHHRNGPYQHSMWKQYRGGDHPVARHLRLNNTMSIDAAFPDSIKREEAKKFTRSRKENMTLKELDEARVNLNTALTDLANDNEWPGKGSTLAFPNLKQYYEPSVTKKYKPFIYDIEYSSGEFGAQTSRVRMSLMNQMVFFENKELNSGLKIAGTSPLTGTQLDDGFIARKQQYYDLVRTAKELGGRRFVYSQTIFPKSVNTFRPYKLEKPNYEEESGTGVNGYDSVINRSFWRNADPGLAAAVTSDGTYRVRTDATASNSQGTRQEIYSYRYFSGSVRKSQAGGNEGAIIEHGAKFLGSIKLVLLVSGTTAPGTSFGPAWNHRQVIIEGGVIASHGVDTTTGSRGADGLPTVGPKTAFVNNESYNPYPISLLSMWPLDPRPDIYNKPIYLTSAIGGKGLQIGLTPHRMPEWNPTQGDMTGRGTYPNFNDPPVTASNSVVFTASLNMGSLVPSDGNYHHGATASYWQLNRIQTGSAGELVYSTKPTIFYHRSQVVKLNNESTDLARHHRNGHVGYRHQTASIQYNRHTFPYNTPFYATNRIRQRNPFFNSYSDFIENIKYIARDHSAIPEYKISDNIEYYYENYFIGQEEQQLFFDSKVKDSPNHPAVRKIRRGFKPTSIKTSNTKLDMLKIDGIAGVTSSADTTSFGQTSPSDLKYIFDPLPQTTHAGKLNTELIHYSQNSNSVVFHEKFSHTDDIIEFSHLVDEPFDDGVDTIPLKIKFTVDAVKKLLPYKNFYPVTKTVDMGSKFKNFIYDNIKEFPLTGSGDGSVAYVDQPTRKPGMLQSFLEPLFAPGILYNSIKSGIAVDYPIFLSKQPAYFAPLPFMSGAVTQSSAYPNYDHDYYFHKQIPAPSSGMAQYRHVVNAYLNQSNGDELRYSPAITSSFNYGGFYMMGAMRGIPAILNRAPNYRLPFEAIYNTKYLDIFVENALYLTTDFLNLETAIPTGSATGSNVVGDQTLPLDPNNEDRGRSGSHPGAAFTPFGPRGFLKKKPSTMTNKHKMLYESSINNYLCETMNFFLEDQGLPGVKLPIAVSQRKSSNDLGFVDDNTYYMEVSLQMGKDHVGTEGPRSAGVGGGSFVDNVYANNNLSASMRGYIYGPPIESVRMFGDETIENFSEVVDPETGEVTVRTEPLIESYLNFDGTIRRTDADFESYFGANLQDPAYQAFTPPYFYGDSSLIVSFTPASQEEGVEYDVYKVWGKSRSESFNFEQYMTGTNGPTLPPSRDALCRYVPGTGSQAGLNNVRMKIESSIDVFNKTIIPVYSKKAGADTTIEHMWYVAPKWICPVLDFSSSYSAVDTYQQAKTQTDLFPGVPSLLTNSFHDATTGRGLWGGYGTDPYDLSHMAAVNAAGDPTDTFEKGIYFSVKFPYYSEKNKQSTATYKSGFNSKQGDFTKRITDDSTLVTASLASELGFDEASFPIGRFAQQKVISEAVIVIPYFDKPLDIKVGSKKQTGPGGSVAWKDIEVPGNEVFSTREIIPGKHFLPIQKTLFENILSMRLSMEEHSDAKLLEKGGAMGYIGFESAASVEAAKQTDVFSMIDVLLGDLEEDRAGYEIPAEFDFINFDIDPFQMIVIPITHTLKKQDLVDIYQGIMPEISLKAERGRSTSTVNPGQNADNFSWMPKIIGENNKTIPLSIISPQNFLSPAAIVEYHKNHLSGYMNTQLSTVWLNNSKEFYKNLKFMTFKVKQKGIKNYERYRNAQISRVVKSRAEIGVADAETLDFSLSKITNQVKRVKDVFGQNWPYDDFSLAEAVKIDIQFEVEK